MRSLLIIAFVALGLATTAAAYPGIVSVDQVSIAPGASGSVAVRIAANNAALSGLVIPLKYASSDVTIDSVSFIGALGANMSRQAYLDAPNKTMRIVIIPEFASGTFASISVASGILGTIHFHTNPFSSPQIITVDSINKAVPVGQNIFVTTRIEFSDVTGLITLLPSYEPGEIVIQSPTDAGDDNSSGLPRIFSVDQNFPNPFNPTTSLSFSLPKAGDVRVEVFNVLGQSVSLLADDRREAGVYSLSFNASSYPSGVYFYRVDYDGFSETRKMLLLK